MKKNKLCRVILFLIVVVNIGCEDNEMIILNNPQVYDKTKLEPWLKEYFIEDEKLNNIEDNLIYNDFLEVWYKYQYNKNGKIKYFKQSNPFGYWEFIDKEVLDKGIGVKTIKLTAPVPSLEIDKYEQSIVKMKEIGPDDVNKYNMFIKFYCTPENTI